MNDCLFCKIASGEIAANIIYQDDSVIVFDDIRPQAQYHKIIIPRRHIATANDIHEDSELVGHMMVVATIVAKELGIAEKGYRLVMNCNKDGGQTVFHIHIHLLGGRSLTWPPG